jgi:hypothetical protein
MDPFENTTQKRRDAQQDKNIDNNSKKIKLLQEKKK